MPERLLDLARLLPLPSAWEHSAAMNLHYAAYEPPKFAKQYEPPQYSKHKILKTLCCTAEARTA